jgi:hypothetical protein
MECSGIHERDEFLLGYERVLFEACPLLESLRFAFTFPDFPANFERTCHFVPLAASPLLFESVAAPREVSLERFFWVFSIFASCCLRDFDTPRILAV